MRIDSRKRMECCGCTACENICPCHAISMQSDNRGFFYPVIDNSKCTDCGACAKICQFHPNYNRDNNFDKPKVYAIRVLNIAELAKSQSGGAFYVLSQKILQNGGVVYGVGFSDHFRAVHKRIMTPEDRDDLRLSKYVQSDIRCIFPQIKDDLSKGLEVLFTGTPCQVAGLKAYLKKNTGKLTTLDLVCHGVPAPNIWEDYLKYLETRYKSEIVMACFRDKKFGWASHMESFVFANRQQIYRKTFRVLFYANYIIRESCANCPYANLQRVGDITIGDFWGWTKNHSEFNDDNGLSLVLVNSKKGERLFQDIQSDIHFIASDTIECLQPQLRAPIRFPKNWDAFVRDYTKHGFEYVAKRYGDIGWQYQMKRAYGFAKRTAKKLLTR